METVIIGLLAAILTSLIQLNLQISEINRNIKKTKDKS